MSEGRGCARAKPPAHARSPLLLARAPLAPCAPSPLGPCLLPVCHWLLLRLPMRLAGLVASGFRELAVNLLSAGFIGILNGVLAIYTSSATDACC